jgi:hypothetical protein
MSEGGDSGSAVFLKDGELVGLLFAGSAEQTICNRIGNVERELGVEILLEEPGEDDGGNGGGDDGDDGHEGPPVYTTTFETDLEFDLDAPTLGLESVTFAEQPRPGATVAAVIVVRASEPGTYWLEVADERRTFEIEADEREQALDVDIPVPDADSPITIVVRGGTLE